MHGLNTQDLVENTMVCYDLGRVDKVRPFRMSVPIWGAFFVSGTCEVRRLTMT